MKRSLFLRIAGAFHLLLGVLFFLFTREATALMIGPPGLHMHLLMKGLSGIVAAFGGMSVLVHRATPGRALNAILGGTLFYLLFTMACDVVWVSTGLLRPVVWVSIGMRTLLAAGYGYYLWEGVQRRRARGGPGVRGIY